MTLTGLSEAFSLSKTYWSEAVRTSMMSLTTALFCGSVMKGSVPGHTNPS